MATIDFETAIATRQLLGPNVEQLKARGHEDRDRNYWWMWTSDAMFPQPAGDAKDDRVFLVHDGRRCGETKLVGELGIDGPSLFYITDDVSTETLSSLADRYELVLDELIQFRDQLGIDMFLATKADALQ